MTSADSMDRRQLFIICVSFCLMIFVATITVGVMPVYVVRLGADAAATGLYLAFNFFGVMAGNMLGGWFSDRSGQRKRITVISYLLWIPAALLMTQATSVAGIILTSGLMWLPGGVAVSALNSIVGLSAGQNERGRVFGWVALASGLGGLIAGLIGGSIAERWGFPALFVVMAVAIVMALLITIAIRDVTVVPDKKPQTQKESDGPAVAQASLGSLVYMLLLANLFARLGATASDLGRPLVMLQLEMNAADVSNAIAFSAALMLPLHLIIGWLSDRIGRKRLLVLFYCLGAVGILLLIAASRPWQFWLSAALVAIINASNGIGQAYIADLSNPKTIGRSLSMLSSSGFAARMIGLGGAGYLMQGIGIHSTLLLGASSLVISIVILLRMHPIASKLANQMIKPATTKSS